MKEFYKKYPTIFHVSIIVLVILLELILITRKMYIIGSGGDWMVQSVSFYEYFRNLFYETRELFPDLALHIGGGQNIYYFVYYGLFSPYLLLSYLFPFVRAGDFIIVTSILNLLVSSILLYYFFIKNGYSKNVSLFGSLLLSTSTSFVFFRFEFIMFIQYIPFLIMGLFGTKKYFDKNNSLLLVISIILIITTNYYFSVSSIICICMYALYYYLKVSSNVKFKIMFRDGFEYALRILLGIIISSFLLLPAIYTIVNGRNGSSFVLNLYTLIPNINLDNLMYDPYGLGLSSIAWFSMIYGILNLKKEHRVLNVILLIIISMPVVDLLLNGFLYFNGKVFIPFIPLFILTVLDMLSNIRKTTNDKIFLIFVVSLLLGFLFIDFSFLRMCVFSVDLIMVYVLLLLCKKKNNVKYIYVVVGFIFSVSVIYTVRRGFIITSEHYNNLYEIINIDNKKYIDNNLSINRTLYDNGYNGINYSDASSIFIPTLYSSTYNNLYREIFYNVFNNNHENYNLLLMPATKNIYFNRFMGVKYLYSERSAPYGYKKVDDFDNVSLYKNENVYSLGYALSSLLSYKEYNKLSYIEKLLSYQNNIIIDGNSNNSDFSFDYEKVNFEYDEGNFNYNIIEKRNLKIKYKDGKYIYNDIKHSGKLEFLLNEPIENKNLVVRFKVNNNYNKHVSVTINGVKNTLSDLGFSYYNDNKTFDYVISSNDAIKKITINFSKGYYEISDIEIYTVDNSFFDKNNTTPLIIDFDKTKGDDLYGSIDVSESGYFIFTIPYDKGYTVYVDGKKVEIEKVNGGFIGFKIDSGEHDIHLTFEAPYAKTGRIVSLIGIVTLVILCIYEKYKKKDD